MDYEIKLPDIGHNIAEVIEILVKVGDHIQQEQSLIIIEDNKASIEVPSPQSGIIKHINVNIGEKIKTGSIIMVLDLLTNEVQKKKQNDSKKYQTIVLPNISNESVEVIDIFVKKGEIIKKEQSIISVEGNKASIEIPSPFEGVVNKILINVGEKITEGTEILILEEVIKSIVDKVILSKELKKDINIKKNKYVHATPLIRRIARKFCINLEKVKATGRKNRILKEDIQKHIANIADLSKTKDNFHLNDKIISHHTEKSINYNFQEFGEVEELKLTSVQKISGMRLSNNWKNIPHVTQYDEVDITDLENFRKKQNLELKLQTKVTLLSFIIKALSKTLKKFPKFNSSLSIDKNKIILKKYYNIGIAVETKKGLIVPVIKDVLYKGIVDLSSEILQIILKARECKLKTSEMNGGCFTISSLGNLGGTAFSPIINAPEVGILGISRASIKPLWDGKEFIPRLILPLSLSFDHRVIDGADGVRFIKYINKMLSDIRYLIM
ncbi:2-oxo acid dehydrogenase subunit E2 [Candidatus Tachikawaea gelatinosa]|uniref:Dihydrolipoamide acetyltransferase component of pyruvate dehydrogenase complex n=1 Tax=Candidatus Tachikawaea gelatinosa TaxID=1410383 RepID=A0A090ALI9_9ENTR|nr:2-oxo acid dehydrogenase subunit E2 [Candidatus Tachikawaea gelatinosa]BAP58509.1 pyruvate dehydrogenase dihydrolipoyltransacetylase subunit [Candidatus Tachikawaea gelatinosa]